MKHLAIPALFASLLVLQGCRKQEPPRPVPPSWKIWHSEDVTFRYPQEYAITTETLEIDHLRIFVNTRNNPSKLILRLDLGFSPAYPVLKLSKSLGQSWSTGIAGYDADRYGPARDPEGVFSEGLLDLGGQGHFLRAHFCYCHLDATEQEQAETIIASLHKQK
jgi:hypothetical protein